MDDAERNTHRHFACEFFNRVWELLDKPNRSADEETEMVNTAHASLCHWLKIGNAQNFSIGEWQISRVYAVLKRAEPAIAHGQRSLEISVEHKLAPFYCGYAHEALARAHALAGNIKAVEAHLAQARALAMSVENSEERAMLVKDLDSVSP